MPIILPFISETALVASSGAEKQTKPKFYHTSACMSIRWRGKLTLETPLSSFMTLHDGDGAKRVELGSETVVVHSSTVCQLHHAGWAERRTVKVLDVEVDTGALGLLLDSLVLVVLSELLVSLGSLLGRPTKSFLPLKSESLSLSTAAWAASWVVKLTKPKLGFVSNNCNVAVA